MRHDSPRNSVTISELVAVVYCERKVVLDRRFGRRDSAFTAAAAAHGQQAHAQFERAGRAEMARMPANDPASDRRCYIATAIYGTDAQETAALRAWRDRVLLPSRSGRVLVAIYYAVSPALVRVVSRSPDFARVGAERFTRALLDRLVRRVIARPVNQANTEPSCRRSTQPSTHSTDEARHD